MERKTGQSTMPLPTKEEIRTQAERGAYDRNPLLATRHEVVCQTCGQKCSIVFLDYLKAGAFELEQTKMVEVVHAAPTITGLEQTMEQMTPITFTIHCKRCGAETPHSPLTLEYLVFTTRRSASAGFYI
ncbi:hypothetical protein AC480_03670 [miscellaneous Crenarchaeota group archaeon SMTZ1-55]|nr:MAG: hypothetical protein AC480_03670 [miscellaneous Crenarchaeota group archaeon SMTZ1-55]